MFKFINRFRKHEHDWELHWNNMLTQGIDTNEYQLFKCKLCNKIELAKRVITKRK